MVLRYIRLGYQNIVSLFNNIQDSLYLNIFLRARQHLIVYHKNGNYSINILHSFVNQNYVLLQIIVKILKEIRFLMAVFQRDNLPLKILLKH